MPIYKLSRHLAASAEKLTGRKDQRHTFWELPESDREWKEDAGNQRVDSLPHVSSNPRLMVFLFAT